MDETVRPLRIPPQAFVYADKHNVAQLVQSMLCSLVIDQPVDPISYLIGLLQRSSDDVPRVIVLGPPAVGKHTVAKKLSAELRAVHVTEGSLLQYQSELSVHAEQELSEGELVGLVQQRLKEMDCFHRERGCADEDEPLALPRASNRTGTEQRAGTLLAFVRTRQRSRTPRILLLGPPGSGKSRQAQLLSEKYGMVDVSCGRLLRSVAAAGSSGGAEVQAYLDGGRPVPDSLLLQVLEERLSRPDCTRGGWILHGFPCDLQQARSLQESHQQPNRVFFLELTDDVCLERLSLRATDPVSGQRSGTFNLLQPSDLPVTGKFPLQGEHVCISLSAL
ncbi:adenylate kinase 8 [Neolamprologus brichardi]|uniref:adenylate kinase 8 n=1 Tax=Neolamprologus brichardi TaxID=32507 RepID=UPI00164378BA|nr:adenylate kinase 8 [Neolamprologus brichardi]